MFAAPWFPVLIGVTFRGAWGAYAYQALAPPGFHTMDPSFGDCPALGDTRYKVLVPQSNYAGPARVGLHDRNIIMSSPHHVKEAVSSKGPFLVPRITLCVIMAIWCCRL